MRRAALLAWLVATAAVAAPPVLDGPAGSATFDMEAPGPRRATLSLTTEHGTHVYSGPLLWDVLLAARQVEAGAARTEAHQTVTVTGADGYEAVLSMGEVSPDFEDKTVILADRVDDAVLGAQRLVIDHDRLASRSVRDVARVTVGP